MRRRMNGRLLVVEETLPHQTRCSEAPAERRAEMQGLAERVLL